MLQPPNRYSNDISHLYGNVTLVSELVTFNRRQATLACVWSLWTPESNIHRVYSCFLLSEESIWLFFISSQVLNLRICFLIICSFRGVFAGSCFLLHTDTMLVRAGNQKYLSNQEENRCKQHKWWLHPIHYSSKTSQCTVPEALPHLHIEFIVC